MFDEIIKRLGEIEKENNITILYACESGSRAWGFDNAESDWDVRFIYKRNNIPDYLSLSDVSEVIEYMDDKMDFVGWDVKKALNLHYSNNPNLREWLLSPIRYIDWQENIFNGLPDFDRATLKYHYTNIATNNWKKLGQDNLELTKRIVKMFLYNCRCVLTWNIIDEGGNPPINIFDLLNQVNLDDNIRNDINTLIASYKKNPYDGIDLEVIDNIKQWMDPNLRIMRRDFPKKDNSKDLNQYNIRFFDIVLPNYEDFCKWLKEL